MGVGGGGGGTYTHTSFTREVTLDNSPTQFSFTAPATMLVDEVNVLCQSVGNRDIPFYAVFIDLKNKEQVGNKVSFRADTVSVSPVLVTGLKASLIKGRTYYLQYGHVTDNIKQLTAPATRTVNYLTELKVFGYDVSDPIWRISTGLNFTSIGGWQSYQGSGHFIRTFDVGTNAVNLQSDGIFLFSDVVPSGTSSSIDLYYTDDSLIAAEAGLQNWDFFATGVLDGTTLPKHRYWRAFVQFSSNITRDKTPELASMTVQYLALPKVFGTVIDTKSEVKAGYFIKTKIPMLAEQNLRIKKTGAKNLSSFNIQASKVNPKFQVSIGGGFSALIAEDSYSNGTFDKTLFSRDTRIRVGYRGIDSTIELYKSKVADVSYRKGGFSLTTKDTTDLFNVKIPSSKSAPTWDSVTTYAAGTQVVYFSALYSAVSSNTGQQPDISPSVWNNIGGPWQDVIYNNTTSSPGQDWHLIDILLDLLTNRINVNSHLIEFGSFESVRQKLANRTGSLSITKPVSAKSLINEISWLLESHLVINNGKISLLKEPDLTASDNKFTIFKRENVKDNTLTYKSGWKNVVNECIILSSYDNSSDSNSSNFLSGEAFVDATSVQEFDGTVSSEVFKDKFNIPPAELKLRAQTFVNKWKYGRGIVRFDASIQAIETEVMDLITINSKQLPEFTNYEFSGIVIEKDVDWLKQKITITLLELK